MKGKARNGALIVTNKAIYMYTDPYPFLGCCFPCIFTTARTVKRYAYDQLDDAQYLVPGEGTWPMQAYHRLTLEVRDNPNRPVTTHIAIYQPDQTGDVVQTINALKDANLRAATTSNSTIVVTVPQQGDSKMPSAPYQPTPAPSFSTAASAAPPPPASYQGYQPTAATAPAATAPA